MAVNVARFNAAFAATARGLVETFRRVRGEARRTDRTMSALRNTVKNAGAVFAGVFTARAAINTFQEVGAEIDKLAKTASKLSVGTVELQGLRLAAEETGVSSSKLDVALQRMTRRISEAAQGSGVAVGALAELGLSADELSRLTPDAAFARIAGAFKNLKNPTDEVRLAFKLFDSEGVGLVNTLRLGEQTVSSYADRVRELGAAVTEVDAANVEAANDALGRAAAVFQGIRQELVIGIAPAVKAFADALVIVRTAVGQVLQQFRQTRGESFFEERRISLTESFAAAIASVADGAIAIRRAFLRARQAIVGVLASLADLVAQFGGSKIGKAVGLGGVGEFSEALRDELDRTFVQIEQDLKNGIQTGDVSTAVRDAIAKGMADSVADVPQLPSTEIAKQFEAFDFTGLFDRAKSAGGGLLDRVRAGFEAVQEKFREFVGEADQVAKAQTGAGFLSGGSTAAFSARLRNVSDFSKLAQIQNKSLREQSKQTGLLERLIEASKDVIADF